MPMKTLKKLSLLIVVGTLAGPLGSSLAQAQSDRLTVVQDESSMERQIEQFLKTAHHLTVDEKFLSPDDLYLELPFKGGPMPKYHYSIDTQSLNKDDAGRIIERGVRLQLLTGINVPPDRLVAVLKIVNDFNRRKVFSAAYIDTNGDVIIDWTLNVMAAGLDTEYVFDALAREDKLWRELYPEISRALQ